GRASLRSKERAMSVDGVPIDSLPKYTAFLYLHPRGRPREMQVLRDGKELSVSVTPVPLLPTIENLTDLITPRKDLIVPLGIFVIDLKRPLAEAMQTRAQSGVIVAGLLSG